MVSHDRRADWDTWLEWGERDVTAVPAEAAVGLLQGRGERVWTAVPGGGHWLADGCAGRVHAPLGDWFGDRPLRFSPSPGASWSTA